MPKHHHIQPLKGKYLQVFLAVNECTEYFRIAGQAKQAEDVIFGSGKLQWKMYTSLCYCGSLNHHTFASNVNICYCVVLIKKLILNVKYKHWVLNEKLNLTTQPHTGTSGRQCVVTDGVQDTRGLKAAMRNQ